MADQAISELLAATTVTQSDLFVLEQNGTAKKLTGQTLINDLLRALDGHGGIQSITKVSTDVLQDTYRILFADTTFVDFVVTNGRGVTSITKTNTVDLVDYYSINYNDGSSQTFKVANGAKGDQGDASYVWIKYASQKPTDSSSSFGDLPDDWMGVYVGTEPSAPTDYSQYTWFKIKGEQGDTGAPATLVYIAIEYQASTSGTIIPSGTWTTDVPVVPQGQYLWTRFTQRFNTGDDVVAYTVSRMGLDGLGSVRSVAGIRPDATGNVSLTAADLGAALEEDLNKVKNFTPMTGWNRIVSNVGHIDYNNQYAYQNLHSVIATEDASTLAGSPVTSGAFYAYREVLHIKNANGETGSKVVVRLTEAYPVRGRVWINAYNPDDNSWGSWQEHYPDQKVSKTGGVMTGYFRVQNIDELKGEVRLYADDEGGTIRIYPVYDNKDCIDFWEIDACSGQGLRFFGRKNVNSEYGEGYVFPLSLLPNGNIKMHGMEMKDFVVVQSTSGIWTYRKWESGIAECWCTIDYSTKTASSVSVSSIVNLNKSFPFTFTAQPVVTGTIGSPAGSTHFLGTITANTTQLISADVFSGRGSGYDISGKISVYVVGKWK